MFYPHRGLSAKTLQKYDIVTKIDADGQPIELFDNEDNELIGSLLIGDLSLKQVLNFNIFLVSFLF